MFNVPLSIGEFLQAWALIAVDDVRDKDIIANLLDLSGSTMGKMASNKLKLRLISVRSWYRAVRVPRGEMCAGMMLLGDVPMIATT